MAEREEFELKYRVQNRTITVKAMDAVGPEDAYDMLLRAVLHRYVVGEEVVPAISRDIKDQLIRQNLVI